MGADDTGATATVTATNERLGDARAGRPVGTPPRWWFHAVVGAATLALLHAASVPSWNLVLAVAAGSVLLAAAAVWAIRGATYALERREGRPPARARWFLVAPVGAVVVVGILAAEAPLQLRWELSRPAFERALAAVADDTTGGRRDAGITGRLGLYHVTASVADGDAVYFVERYGGFLDDVGFAHLPDGPASATADPAFEGIEVRPIGGDWYTWTASW